MIEGTAKLRCHICNKLLATIALPVSPIEEIRGLCNSCYLKYSCAIGTGFMEHSKRGQQ